MSANKTRILDSPPPNAVQVQPNRMFQYNADKAADVPEIQRTLNCTYAVFICR